MTVNRHHARTLYVAVVANGLLVPLNIVILWLTNFQCKYFESVSHYFSDDRHHKANWCKKFAIACAEPFYLLLEDLCQYRDFKQSYLSSGRCYDRINYTTVLFFNHS